ncbi:MAG TPA: cytochrome c [Acidobacteriaceae bacterium]|jgi:hypothetical protein|nr:cytochrome c [Acidobacteriaceae bacterium]
MRIRHINSVSRQQISRWMLVPAGMLLLAVMAGCRQDMQNEPKIVPQRGTTFFASGRSVRPEVLHAVARNQLDANEYFYTGLIDGKEQDKMPFPVTMTVLLRGQERYNIYCTPCHSRVGNGRGMIVERGYKPAGDYHDSRILNKPISHYFFVMTHGYGAMPNYAAQVTPQDRWAIAAYIRALQLSQAATLKDVPANVQVQSLAEVSQQMGYSPSFVGEWALPESTNVPSAGEMTPSSFTSGKANATQSANKKTGSSATAVKGRK